MTDQNLRRSPWSPRVLLTVAVLLALSFSAGYVWQFVEAREARGERDQLQQELFYQELATTLATATLQADGGAYENARTLMSRFFTRLQDHVATLPPGTGTEAREILGRRDQVITELSRSDPASEETLARLFSRYQVVLGDTETTLPLPAAGSAPASASPTPAADTAGARGDSVGR